MDVYLVLGPDFLPNCQDLLKERLASWHQEKAPKSIKLRIATAQRTSKATAAWIQVEPCILLIRIEDKKLKLCAFSRLPLAATPMPL